MNEKTLNNTTTVRGNQHFGGFILLERVDSSRHWRAHDWSAFFAYMVMSFGSCKSFLDNNGRAVTELSEYKVMELNNRLETAGEHTPDRMVFAVPASLAIPDRVFTRWKENLPTEIKNESYELQNTLHP